MKTAGDDALRKMAETFEAWRGTRILVVGDMMLDEYLHGRSERVSREAPVLIVRYQGSSFACGGAANAAVNVAALGGEAVACGVTGRDETAERLHAALLQGGVSASRLIAVAGRCTTSKLRVMAGDYHAQQQQIVRIDREDEAGIPARIQEKVLRGAASVLRSCAAMILSDYGRGVLNESTIPALIAAARGAGIPVVADSRFALRRFRGVTTATPNEVEAAAAAGVAAGTDETLERAGRALLRRLGSDSLLITRGKLGMALFRPRVATEKVGVVGSSEATDVTGAGDTVVAVIALALGAGADMSTAMRLANIAASIVVMKRGTAATSPDEIRAAIERLSAGGKGGAG